MNYKTVAREVFLAYFAFKDFNGDWIKAREVLEKLEIKYGKCLYAVPDVVPALYQRFYFTTK
jgi:hypothetical protein